MNITDVSLVIAMLFGPCSLAYLILNDLSVSEADLVKSTYCSKD